MFEAFSNKRKRRFEKSVSIFVFFAAFCEDFCDEIRIRVNSRDSRAGIDCCMRFGFSIIFGLILMAPCVYADQTPSAGETGIEGVITISPAQAGPVRDDGPSSKPLVNATFAVENEKGPVASFTTDGQGHFRTSLPPGHYKVSMQGRKSSIGRFGPFEVDVVAAKMTRVQWECDSGIR